ncbi:hypothetical protein CYMTET_44326 [Cymbomonas tetramitiformis]|uniref:Uncharacterized protein n=1 Tax=Cymbomonas tetramitiformis TaxID=36881 RepID=A0AAE0C274_9CHLO|nr:hypothetical protein CYMTET_44326 [Cymbomonas tetramitiformis]
MVAKYALLCNYVCADRAWEIRCVVGIFFSKLFFWTGLGARSTRYFVDIEVILDLAITVEEYRVVSEENGEGYTSARLARITDDSLDPFSRACVQFDIYSAILCGLAFGRFVSKKRGRRSDEVDYDNMFSEENGGLQADGIDDSVSAALACMYLYQAIRILSNMVSPACADTFEDPVYVRSLRIAVDFLYIAAIRTVQRVNVSVAET